MPDDVNPYGSYYRYPRVRSRAPTAIDAAVAIRQDDGAVVGTRVAPTVIARQAMSETYSAVPVPFSSRRKACAGHSRLRVMMGLCSIASEGVCFQSDVHLKERQVLIRREMEFSSSIVKRRCHLKQAQMAAD